MDETYHVALNAHLQSVRIVLHNCVSCLLHCEMEGAKRMQTKSVSHIVP